MPTSVPSTATAAGAVRRPNDAAASRAQADTDDSGARIDFAVLQVAGEQHARQREEEDEQRRGAAARARSR